MSKTSSLNKRLPKVEASSPPERPSDSTSKWSADEETRLVALVEKSETPVWPKLSKHFPGKSAAQCQAKWQEILKRESKKGNWTPEEDEQLKKWVAPTNLGRGTRSIRVDQLRAGHHWTQRQAVQREVGQHTGPFCQDRGLVGRRTRKNF